MRSRIQREFLEVSASSVSQRGHALLAIKVNWKFTQLRAHARVTWAAVAAFQEKDLP